MTARDVVFASIRRSLGVSGQGLSRRQTVANRITAHPPGIIPARGQLPPRERVDMFVTMVEGAAGTVDRVAAGDDVPAALAAFLRRHNVPLRAQRGADPYLAGLPWAREATLTVEEGAPDPASLAAVSHAAAGIAEMGTLVLLSGRDNPTSLNFLPDNHVVVLEAKDVVCDYESVWARLRKMPGIEVPRAINLITGPSRTADIEQTLILGAHGPRRLHVILVGEARESIPPSP
jgi:L-lactate dehydrogenase complex protein LldG